MPGFDFPQEGPTLPNDPPQNGPVIWTHVENDSVRIASAALETARTGTWEVHHPITRQRYLRALTIMSLQAASFRTEPHVLGNLSGASYADDEHNAAGAAAARTILLLAPRGVALVSQSMLTVDGEPPSLSGSPDTGLGPLAIVAVVAAVGAAAYLIGRYTGQAADRADFRENKTRQLISTQATVIETLTTHAQRERIAGKPLPFSPEERRLLESLEHTQQQIADERHVPLPSPFDGAKTLEELGRSASSALDSLLPIAVIGGAIYLFSKCGGNAEAHAPAEPAPKPQAMTLTRNKEGIYEYDERNS